MTPSGSGSPAWNAVGRVERRLTDGTPVAGQGLPVEVGWWWRGLGPFCGSPSVGACESAPYSLQLVRDGDDGAVVVFPEYYVDGELLFRACRIAATGLSQSVGGGSGPAPRLQRTRTDSFLITRFHVTGPNYFIGPPELVVYWSDGRGVRLEEDYSPYQPVYSDLAAAPLPDGGAIAVWGRLFAAQSGLSPGLYAQRIGANGTVLEASHSPRMSDGLSLSRTGSGVLATWPSGAPGTLRMHDVLGREVARHDIGSEAGTVHLTLEGASPTGIYFGRITRRDGSNATARVFMLR